jgi:PAS domain S-box-containing protein
VFRQPIVLDGEQIGLLVLRSNYGKELRDLLKLYLVTLLAVLSFSILLAFLLSARLQRVISLPILSLARTARAVAERNDFSARAEKVEDDEIGLLTDAFNQMLEQIQAQDAALRAAHQQKFESLVNSIDGIVWEAEPEGLQFHFVSQQAERLLGYPTQQWLNSPSFWHDHLSPSDRKQTHDAFQAAVAALKPFALEFRMTAADGREIWVRNNTTVIAEEGQPKLLRGVMLDITERRQAEEKLEQLHKQLLSASRQAGMAEVATGVLHNVGNVLNSVNVSASLVYDRLKQTKSANLGKLATLLNEHGHDLAQFLTEHPKGKVIPSYLASLAELLAKERTELLNELTLLNKHVQHIKDIVAMQQSYARISGVTEVLPVAELLEDALQLNEAGFTRHGIHVVREFAAVPPVAVDKHKVLQILINLLRNAKHALQEYEQADRRIRLSIEQNGHNRVQIVVQDNGVGIAPENLTRVFSHGFTTKKQGHGFGLHSGALAAKEMGGSLTAHSEGLGKGSSFILELPIAEAKTGSENGVHKTERQPLAKG